MRRSLFLLLLVVQAAVSVPLRAAPVDTHPWLNRRVLSMAHQGGEIEAPSNTLFAFKRAVKKGSDVLEMDVHSTVDGEIVVIHDATVNRTTNGVGRVDQMTLEQVRSLDAAYWHVPGCGTCHDQPEEAYKHRGYATGRVLPRRMRGVSPDDFKIPTLREVLETFPDVLLNIEIKGTAPATIPYEYRVASLLEEFGRSDDVIVASFHDHAMESFKVYAPEVSTAPGTVEAAIYWASSQGPAPGSPNPRYAALQVPLVFEGVEVVNRDFVQDAHTNDLAVHVWTINDRQTMERLIDIGVDGIMTDQPKLLEQVLTEKGVRFAL